MHDTETRIKGRILFVDDDYRVAEAYKRILRKEFLIETALGGEQGLEAIINQGPFDVIVSDLRMPHMDGNEFLSRVKEMAPESIRIMLTAHADLETAIEAINKGNIFRLLTKPCAPEMLAEALDEALEQFHKHFEFEKNPEKDRTLETKKTVLIVDHDPVTREIISKALEPYDELEVLTACDGQTAVRLLSEVDKIDLVISDLDIQSMGDLGLPGFIRQHYPETGIFVLTGSGSPEIEQEIKAMGHSYYFEKPLYIDVFVETVLEQLHSPSTGQIHGISIASFLQVVNIEEKTCTLKVRSNGSVGYLHFLEGDLMAAETEQLSREEAAHQIIGWDKTVIEVEDVCNRTEKEIEMPLMYILMESARIKDEKKA